LHNHVSTVTKFATVGVLNTVVDAGLFAALISTTSMAPVVANVISYSAGMLNSYILNRVWTFRKSSNTQMRPEFVRFVCFNLVALALSSAIIWQESSTLGVFRAKALAVLVTFVFGYAVNKYFVFSQKSESA
jgi:putative flippase GtrA